MVHGNTVGCFVLRGDDVGHGFGLGQVELPVNERPAGELTWHGHPRACFDEKFQKPLLDIDRAMHADLHRIFSSEGMRRGEKGDQHLVEGLV